MTQLKNFMIMAAAALIAAITVSALPNRISVTDPPPEKCSSAGRPLMCRMYHPPGAAVRMYYESVGYHVKDTFTTKNFNHLIALVYTPKERIDKYYFSLWSGYINQTTMTVTWTMYGDVTLERFLLVRIIERNGTVVVYVL